LNGSYRRGRFPLVRPKYPGVKSGDLLHLIGVRVERNLRQRCVDERSETGTGWTLLLAGGVKQFSISCAAGVLILRHLSQGCRLCSLSARSTRWNPRPRLA
jgi:hypothetical protein